jgi:hypothetical protein
MDLNFELQGSYFIAEFEVTSDFNLHIEKDPIGEFFVYQRTAGGQYDLVQNFKKDKGDDSIIDYDFQALVYPKWIKIKSSVKPLVAIVTMEANEDIPEEGGETIEPEDLLYYMDGTLNNNEGFVVNLNTGELIFSDNYHRDKYSYLYSVSGNTISIKDPGYGGIKYGIVHLPSVEILKIDGRTQTVFPGIFVNYSGGYGSELPVTKIGKWEFNKL